MSKDKKLIYKNNKNLNPLQYSVTQENCTEPPFNNEYWDNKKQGIYVDIVSGEPLFCSIDKYDSGSGWPSFTKPLVNDNIVYNEDNTLSLKRIEVRSKNANSHLGHVFDDGPSPSGKRYCINSAALKFIPVEDMEKEGYGEYLNLFGSNNSGHEFATFAAGCFWGVEDFFSGLKGVIDTTVGYTGGDFENPSYEDVCAGKTGHAESVLIEYNPKIISFESLVEYFFKLHDPTTLNRQGPDLGSQYRSAIFYHNDKQKNIAEKIKNNIDKKGIYESKIVTQIVPADKFYKAEEYHQDYFKKSGIKSCHTLKNY